GTIDFRNFIVNKLQIDYSGARDAFVSAINTLNGNIFYKGNIYYNGSPSLINVKQRDAGKLLHF
ncbi:MAG TPA: hypothetical protein VGO09_02235, partial [Flavisolibacter sp.]|nr:hypothetical protein [Flavisolibacter sp.]